MLFETLPKLYGLSRIGKVKEWQVSVQEMENGQAV